MSPEDKAGRFNVDKVDELLSSSDAEHDGASPEKLRDVLSFLGADLDALFGPPAEMWEQINLFDLPDSNPVDQKKDICYLLRRGRRF